MMRLMGKLAMRIGLPAISLYPRHFFPGITASVWKGRMDGLMDRWMARQTDGRMDGCMMDGRTDIDLDRRRDVRSGSEMNR